MRGRKTSKRISRADRPPAIETLTVPSHPWADARAQTKGDLWAADSFCWSAASRVMSYEQPIGWALSRLVCG
jgi:hypothetical protein